MWPASHVYVAVSPDLWVYTDDNHDLKADGPPRKLLTGFGGENHDHGAHSLVLGPDHKWWMSHGDRGCDVTGTDGSQIKSSWGSIVRGELDGSKLEMVAENFRNPYEVCVNSFGEAYCSDNDNDGYQGARICWVMEGGNYGWYGHIPQRPIDAIPYSKHWHFRGHIPGHVPGTLITGFGAPGGICVYEGYQFGPKFKDALLLADSGTRELSRYSNSTVGAGHATTGSPILSADDPYFRPVDVSVTRSGTLMVADWYDGIIGGHNYNNREQGRIFHLQPQHEPRATVAKPGPYTNVQDALGGLKSPNLATQYLAREKLLAGGEASTPQLEELLSDEDLNVRAAPYGCWIVSAARLVILCSTNLIVLIQDSGR